jgi:hypothetical protein
VQDAYYKEKIFHDSLSRLVGSEDEMTANQISQTLREHPHIPPFWRKIMTKTWVRHQMAQGYGYPANEKNLQRDYPESASKKLILGWFRRWDECEQERSYWNQMRKDLTQSPYICSLKSN